MIPVILATFSLFTVIFNLITVVYILRKKVAPYYFKVKLSLVLNAIWCLSFGWLIVKSSGIYDRMWLVVFLLLMFWYALILILNWPPKKTT
jgi:hypothetical protein